MRTDADLILGTFARFYHGDLPTTSREAWAAEIGVMKEALKPLENERAQVLFEYDIPRLGRRLDVVLLARGIVVCLEFKTGAKGPTSDALDQVMEYALDLKNFHQLSQDCVIVPVLVPTSLPKKDALLCLEEPGPENIVPICIVGARDLRRALTAIVDRYGSGASDEWYADWALANYRPSPSIIEAARALYTSHSVQAIMDHEADDDDTAKTIEYVLDVISASKREGRKSICFVTGVPGAGKTLVGLEIAVKQTYQDSDAPRREDGAVYLSGNGPLVAVLTEALARDNAARVKGKKLGEARQEVKKFIQVIHNYRDNMLRKIKNPVENGVLEIDPAKAIRVDEQSGYGEVEHVAIFDEAQRSWAHAHLANYLKRGGTYGNKYKVPNFPLSEAAFLIWSLDQRNDWATIVCLVGGGQEINTGEAGIGEWIQAVSEHFPHWQMHISDRLTAPEYAEGRVAELLEGMPRVTLSGRLHLSVSRRSFRAEKVSDFVHALLDIDPQAAAEILKEIGVRYPICLTRDMESARRWLRSRTLRTERAGVFITKSSARYKPEAVHVLGRDNADAVNWFLADAADTRSSCYLEDAATEIQVQGLEVDYACVLWDADMQYDTDTDRWRFFNFNGRDRWNEQTGKTQGQVEQMRYMLNAYRVLLTRARKGMVVCVPKGNPRRKSDGDWEDSTRRPDYYDGTYRYLQSIGLKKI